MVHHINYYSTPECGGKKGSKIQRSKVTLCSVWGKPEEPRNKLSNCCLWRIRLGSVSRLSTKAMIFDCDTVKVVFVWWNEVKQNIPTIRVFSQKKISIIRFFCGISLFWRGSLRQKNSKGGHHMKNQPKLHAQHITKGNKLPSKNQSPTKVCRICIPGDPVV